MASAAVLIAFGLVLAYLAWKDLRERQIPNRMVLTAAVIALSLAPWSPAGTYLNALGGLGIGFGVLFMLYLPFPYGVGAGDVKLAALLGALLGYPDILWALGIGAVIGGFITLATWKWQKSLPMAPCLVAGAGIIMAKGF